MGTTLPDDVAAVPDGVSAAGAATPHHGLALAGGGAMGALMRAFDWSRTPVGPAERWPQSLRTALGMLLDSLYPMLILWGPEYVQFYNDAYRPVLGATKHPGALGQRARECWPEIWEMIGPMFDRVLARGEATGSEDLLFVLDRNGYLEETYFTFCYSAIRDETGAPGGVLVTCVETTARVLGERRLRCLRELAAHAAQAETAEAACVVAARTLGGYAADVPFALLYLLEDLGPHALRACLVGAVGLDPDTPASPATVDLPLAAGSAGTPSPLDPSGEPTTWPLGMVAQTGLAAMVADARATFGPLPGGPWPESATQALVLPIAQPGEARPAGLLVVGLSPRRALGDDYRGFLDLVAGQIAAAVANARAREAERRRAEALADLDRAKTAFFSNVSHEFRTPLSLLLGPLQDVLEGGEARLGPEDRERLELSRRNAQRLLRLVNTLLDFSRIEAGRVEASYEPTDLATLTADLASAFRSAVERAALRLVVDCPLLPEPVYVDREMWEKIVLNLLSNAFKHTFKGEIAIVVRPLTLAQPPPGGRTGRGGPDHVELLVRDTGVGIPAEELPRVFERFHRVRGARARTHEGSGIGLALVQELVRLHGGSIEVASEVGRGTTFTVRLPLGQAHLPTGRIGATRSLATTALGATAYLAEAERWLPEDAAPRDAAGRMAPTGGPPDLPAPAPGPAPSGQRRARVLVADDNADMRLYLRHLLGERWAVEVVADGATALDAARATPPDLVLADVMMPGLDGFGLLRALRADARTRAVPVVLLSARAGAEAAVEGLEAGADDYLVKPFAANELLARVQAHLALARLRQEAHDALAAERDRLQTEVAARIGAEEELRQSHEQLRRALAAARMVSWEWDPRTDAVTTSENVAEIYGTGRLGAAAAGFALVHPGDRARHEATARRAAATAGTYHSTFRITRPDTGEIVWLEERGAAVTDGEGVVTRLTGLTLDISARARVEEELRASEARHRAIVETANEGIWLVDREARTLFANARLAALLGTTVEGLLARTMLDYVFPEDLPLARERIGQNLAGTPEQFDFRYRRADGTAVEVLACTSPVRDGTGAIIGALGMFSDITERRRADASLRQQAALLALARDAIIVRAADGHIVAWNDGAAALYGWGVAEAVGMRTHELLRTLVLPEGGSGEEMDAALAAHGAWEGTLEHTRRDGARVVVESRQALLRAADGRPEVVLEINRDMAVRLALEAALARLQALQAVSDAALAQLDQPALLRQLLERIRVALAADNAAILLLDEAGRDLIVHEAQGPEEVQIGQIRVPVGLGVAGRIAATRQPLIVADMGRVAPVNPLLRQMASLLGVPLLVEGRLIGVMHVDSVTPRQFAEDDLRLLQLVADRVALALDNARLYQEALAARDRAEELAQRLQEERDRLQHVLDAVPEGVVIVDTTLRVVMGNPGAAALLGQHLVGRMLATDPGQEDTPGAPHPDGTPYPGWELPVLRSLLRGEVVQGEQCLLRHPRTGADLPVLLGSAPFHGQGGAIAGAVLIIQDISGVTELERQKDEFLAAAAHDLKNPLTTIKGLAQLLQRRAGRVEGGGALLEGLSSIEQAAGQMAALINQLLDTTRLQMGRVLELERRPTDLVALAHRVTRAHQQTTVRHEIQVQRAPTALEGFWDAARLERVLNNLLSNAVKYSPDGGRIAVDVDREEEPDGPWAVLRVEDQGIGIPEAELPRIFERFYRASNAAGRVQGTGIGLAGARQLVEQHGGRVAVSSREGEGTVVTVRLPLGGEPLEDAGTPGVPGVA